MARSTGSDPRKTSECENGNCRIINNNNYKINNINYKISVINIIYNIKITSTKYRSYIMIMNNIETISTIRKSTTFIVKIITKIVYIKTINNKIRINKNNNMCIIKLEPNFFFMKRNIKIRTNNI